MNFLIGMTDGVSAPAKAGADSLADLQATLKSCSDSLQDLTLLNEKVAESLTQQAGAGDKASKSNEEQKKTGESLRTVLAELSLIYLGVTAAIHGTVDAVKSLGGAFADMAGISEAKGDATRSLELLYGSQEAAENTYKAIEGITSRVAISQSRALELSDSLVKAGETNGDRMIKSIEAIGKAEAARKGAGQVLEGVITRANSSKMFSISRQELRAVGLSYRDMAQEISKQTGKGVAETEIQMRTGGVRLKEGLNALTAVVDAKMGDLANRKFMTVGNQTQRLQDNFKRLFESFDTGPMARGLKVIADLLDESSVSGSGLRTFLKSAFEEIGKVVEWLAPYVSLFFDGMILAALKIYNALYPLRKALKDTFGGDNGTQDFQNVMLSLADDVGAFVGKTAEFLADLVRNWDALWQTFDEIMSDPLGAILGGFGEMLTSLNDMLTEAWASAVHGVVDLGKDIVDGIVNGIMNGVGAVGEAFSNLAHAGLNKFKSVLGIHSPSRVMMEMGDDDISGALATGVTRGSGKAQAAMAGTAASLPGAASAGARAAGGGSAGGGGVSVVFQSGAIVISGAGDAQMSELKAKLTDLMADVFQQAALLNGEGAAA